MRSLANILAWYLVSSFSPGLGRSIFEVLGVHLSCGKSQCLISSIQDKIIVFVPKLIKIELYRDILYFFHTTYSIKVSVEWYTPSVYS